MRRKELMKRGLAILIASTMVLSGCGSDNNSSPASSTKDTNTEKTENVSDDLDNTTPENDNKASENDSKTSENNSDTTTDNDNSPENDTEDQESKNDSSENDSPENDDDESDSSETENAENETADFTDINSGDIYETLQSIDPDLQVQDANSGEYLQITMDKPDVDVDSQETIHRFFWDAVQFLKTEIFKDTYDHISFTFLGKDSFESFSVSKFENFDNFMTSYIGPLSKNDTNYFSSYYKTVFATRDTSGATNKLMYELSKKNGTDYELPDSYQEAYLWILANFDYRCGFSIKEKTVTVTIPAEKTVESGANTGPVMVAALEALNEILIDRPEVFPYEKLSITCIDQSTGSTLLTRTYEKSISSWKTTENTGVGDFAIGYNNSFSSNSDTNTENTPEIPDNESQQQTSESYVLNTSTMKIHKPSCSAAKKIAPENYSTSDSSISELEAQGYSRCGICLK